MMTRMMMMMMMKMMMMMMMMKMMMMMMMMMAMVMIMSLICCTSAPTRQVAKECLKTLNQYGGSSIPSCTAHSIHPGGRRKDMSSCLLVFPVLLSVISAVHFLGPLLCTKNASFFRGLRGIWICRAHLSNLLHVASDTGISNEGDWWRSGAWPDSRHALKLRSHLQTCVIEFPASCMFSGNSRGPRS